MKPPDGSLPFCRRTHGDLAIPLSTITSGGRSKRPPQRHSLPHSPHMTAELFHYLFKSYDAINYLINKLIYTHRLLNNRGLQSKQYATDS